MQAPVDSNEFPVECNVSRDALDRCGGVCGSNRGGEFNACCRRKATVKAILISELGSWKIHLKRLEHPLTGSKTWVEFDGTSVTRKVWDGRSQIEEFEVDSPSGHIEGLTLRLYNPQSHQWSLYWANSKAGTMGGPPNVGEFKDGRGEFLCQDTFEGRMILIRYVWSDITPKTAHFEQSFSDDGGKTWEVNWITDQTRVGDEPAKAQ
jgi:hypothetical protein